LNPAGPIEKLCNERKQKNKEANTAFDISGTKSSLERRFWYGVFQLRHASKMVKYGSAKA
jgi:hypothetical protein